MRGAESWPWQRALRRTVRYETPSSLSRLPPFSPLVPKRLAQEHFVGQPGTSGGGSCVGLRRAIEIRDTRTVWSHGRTIVDGCGAVPSPIVFAPDGRRRQLLHHQPTLLQLHRRRRRCAAPVPVCCSKYPCWLVDIHSCLSQQRPSSKISHRILNHRPSARPLTHAAGPNKSTCTLAYLPLQLRSAISMLILS